MFGRKSKAGKEDRNKYDDRIMEAVLENQPAKLSQLLEKKKYTSLTSIDPEGRVALMEAAKNGYDAIAEELLEHDADASVVNDDGHTALHVAAMKGHTKVVNILLKKGVPKNTQDGKQMTALHHAVFNSHEDTIGALIAHACDTEATDKDGNTALLLACKADNKSGATALCNASANVNAVNRMHKTSLMLACENGNRDLARFLLDRGADAGKKDTGGRTAMSYAKMGGHNAIVDMLPADAPMGKIDMKANESTSMEPTSPETLKRMDLAKKYPPPPRRQSSSSDLDGSKKKAVLISELEKSRDQIAACNDEIEQLKAQLAAYTAANGNAEEDDEEINFDSDDEIDLGTDPSENASKDKELADMKAQVKSLKNENKSLQKRAQEAEDALSVAQSSAESTEALKEEIARIKEAHDAETTQLSTELREVQELAHGNGDDDLINVYRHHLLLAVEGKLSAKVAEGIASIATVRRETES